MTYRKIVVDSKSYRYNIGSNFIVIQDADGKRIYGEQAHKFKNMTPYEWERAGWKGYGWVRPYEIANKIKEIN